MYSVCGYSTWDIRLQTCRCLGELLPFCAWRQHIKVGVKVLGGEGTSSLMWVKKFRSSFLLQWVSAFTPISGRFVSCALRTLKE